MDNKFDIIIVGAGPGGYVCAIKASQEGLKTLIVEKEYYGGVCLNVGCIPTKALLKGAKVYDMIQHADMYGIDIKNLTDVAPNWVKMQERKAKVVDQLTKGVEYLLKKNKVTLVKGEAKALDKNTIEVDGNKYTCDNLIIATGSVSRSLPLPGFDKATADGFVISSTEALSLPQIPKKLAVIGGGVIGVEFACLYRRLGTEVTILQGLDTILEMLDKDVREEMTKLLIKNKVKIETSVKIKEIKGKTIIYNNKDGQEVKLATDYCLVSVGRVPVLTGFENIGLKIGERKNIEINDQCQTNLSGVYAIGDVVGKAMLAHVASAQGIVAINNIKGYQDKIEYNKIPSCIYSHPEVAMVGLTEEQAIKQNIQYKAFKFPLKANGKALADGETDGFVKILCEPKYGEILGAHIICATATDMISEITLCMEIEGTIYDLAKAVHPHPTLSEIIMEVAHGLEGHPIGI
ncbi:dihydrolipoyl dehydrogenase [Spiroplasma eriocheiris]|uniref:Dihydrolipoyl dehydrogenase n=1 Tax=Spiroplasma eriocheiris TaxID=315358 RepID=A0A0H3XJC6_9MOLU|nr:dihydrolipoyl dehydrogenase [Spiroplasma eriocheiris]AHF57469.1 pyruvate dehydrogenase E3 (dihydrolipoamide dehydrogenase) component [Spiroplasma eriocheiris CCTCC M 207170]AKM53926.1 pyruvate dehydrogenase E3 component [Spiroplasma eriocheiris]